MRPILRGTALSLIVLAVGGALWGQALVECPRAAAPPVLDGNVTTEEWVAAARLSPFLLLDHRGLPTEATDVQVMYDEDALYVGAVMHDAQTDALRAEVTTADGEVWEDDCCEVFIDAVGTGESYVHFVVNPRGTQFDELDRDPLANYEWAVGVAVHDDDWSVEMAIPFGAGRPPDEGTVWRVGVGRHAARLNEFSSWHGAVGSFHEAERFGELRFGGSHVAFNLVDMGARRLGRNSAVLLAANATPDDRAYKANVRVMGRDRTGHFFGATKFAAPAGQRTVVDAPYEVVQDGAGTVLLSVTDDQGTAVFRTAPFPISLPAVSEALFDAESMLADLSQEWGKLPESPGKAAIREELNALFTEWRALANLAANRAALDSAALSELQMALEALGDRAQELLVRTRATNLSGGEVRSFVVTPVSSLEKIMPDHPPVPLGTEARIEACRNEWESLQLVVQPTSSRLVRLSVAVSGLAGAGRAIPSSWAEVRAVGYVPAADHLQPGAPKRLWPDLLTPGLAEDDVVEIEATTPQPLWVSVHVPEDASPGEYTGTIALAEEGGSEAWMPLTVVVHNAVLPSAGEYRFSLGFWQSPEAVAEQYGLGTWSGEHWELLHAYLEDLAAHGQKLATVRRNMFEWRLNEAGQPVFNYTVFDRYVSLCREVGIDEGIEYYSMFNTDGDSTVTWVDAAGSAKSETANPGDEAYDTAWTAFLTDFAAHLEEQGWLENVFICPADEPRDTPDAPVLDRFARCAELVHAADPRLKVTVALDSLESACKLAPHADRMVFKLRDDVYDRELAAEKRASGGRVEAYICCHPDRPNTFITSPNIDSRVIGWLIFREQLQGLLRWSYERWPPDPRGQPEGDGRYAAGDLFIVYPGPDGPYPSPRWEILRDGIEDYECLRSLEEAIALAEADGRTAEAGRGRSALEAAVKRVVGEGPGFTEFTDDPAELFAARSQVLAALDRLSPQG